MDLRPSQEQQQLVAAFSALYSDLSTPSQVQAAEPGGYSADLWQALRDTGAVDMAVPEARGGWGASLLDLALVAEQHGRWVAPAPLIEAQVAARLLARTPGTQDLLDSALSGAGLVTLALRPAVEGRASLVPSGSTADTALILDGNQLLAVALEGHATTVANLGALPLADVDVTGARVLADGPEVVELFAQAIDEWRVLTASSLAGLAERALEIAVAYVKERKAFGQAIGSFQGVAHRLADRACEVDGAVLLAREAAWAVEEEPDRAAELAALALGFATETARDTTYHALHFHGGYGFMLEYAVQLYFRRARTWSAVLEDPRTSYRLAGQARLLTGAAR
jgi:alkylation response protein AidB-like acyl-CoA dehydrogenase